MPDTLRSIDLHAHTTASDGQHSPSELVRRAHALGLTAIGITDHDTTAGIAEALESGAELGIEVVPGIELSAEIEVGQCHILGYFIDANDTALISRLRYVVEMRNSRNGRIVNKLRDEFGFEITLEEIEAIAGGDIVARPHFARALVKHGYVASMQEAFDVYLGKGGKAYVDRVRLSPEEAIGLIHGAGGVAILAHPNNLKRDAASTEIAIRELIDAGLDGIEARYNRHSPTDNARYLKLAAQLGVLTSGGSDYHGEAVKADVQLGHVEGASPAPREVLEEIRAKT